MASEHIEIRCTSCGRNVVSEDKFSKFKCPSCGKTEIIRCNECRKSSNTYICKECGFEGP